MKTKTRVSLVLAVAAVATAGSVAAQQIDNSASTRTGVSDVLTEIVVKAEKRASTVQDTPISMTAITEELKLIGRSPNDVAAQLHAETRDERTDQSAFTRRFRSTVGMAPRLSRDDCQSYRRSGLNRTR
jgi:hypothetical protein